MALRDGHCESRSDCKSEVFSEAPVLKYEAPESELSELRAKMELSRLCQP